MESGLFPADICGPLTLADKKKVEQHNATHCMATGSCDDDARGNAEALKKFRELGLKI